MKLSLLAACATLPLLSGGQRIGSLLPRASDHDDLEPRAALREMMSLLAKSARKAVRNVTGKSDEEASESIKKVPPTRPCPNPADPNDMTCPLPNGVDYPGQTFAFCTPGLDCPENPKMHRHDDPAFGRSKNVPADRQFSQDERQYFLTHSEQFGPVRFISRGNPEIPQPEHHPAHMADEVLELPVPVPLYPGQEAVNLTVREILANGERVTGPEGRRIRDYMPTDGLLIMYDGKIVYEDYFSHAEPGGQTGEYSEKFGRFTRHRLYSVTKGYAGVMVAMLAEEGSRTADCTPENKCLRSIDDKISDYIHPLKTSDGWKDVTIRQAMDMSNNIKYNEFSACNMSLAFEAWEEAGLDEFGFVRKENIDIPDGCEAGTLFSAMTPGTIYGFPPLRPFTLSTRYRVGSDGFPIGARKALEEMKMDADGVHGVKYKYNTASTVALAWLIDTLTGYNSAEYFSKKIWSQIGAEADMIVDMDDLRFNSWGSGGSATLRDITRFGEMIRKDGVNAAGDQILPEPVVRDLKDGGDTMQYALGIEYFLNALIDPAVAKNVNFMTHPVESWLKAMGKPTNGTSGLAMAYHNQFRAIINTGIAKGHVIYQQGILGQHVWIDETAKVVISRLGSGNPGTSSLPQSTTGWNAGPGIDVALFRAFFEIAAYFIDQQSREGK